MAIQERVSPTNRVRSALGKTFRVYLVHYLPLLLGIFPLSLAIMLLDASGFLHPLCGLLDSVTLHIGLRGEALLVFAVSCFGNGIGAVTAIRGLGGFTGREISLLALMCLLAYNLIGEGYAMRKTGTSFSKMFVFRIMWALASAALLNLLLPGTGTLDPGRPAGGFPGPEELRAFVDPENLEFLLVDWLPGAIGLFFLAGFIVLAGVFLQYILLEFGILALLSKIFYPFMGIMGLPPYSSYPWITGLAFGFGKELTEAETVALSRQERDLLNHHLALNHSWIVDTMLYSIAAGGYAPLMLFPRLIMAVIFVWMTKAKRSLTQRSYRVHIES